MRYRVKNIGSSVRGVRATGGQVTYLNPGQEWTGSIEEGEMAVLQRRGGHFDVTPVDDDGAPISDADPRDNHIAELHARLGDHAVVIDGQAQQLDAANARIAELTADRARLQGENDALRAAPPAPKPAAASTDAPVADQFDAMDDDALRAFIETRDGKKPHPAAKRETLLAKARNPATPDAEPAA